MSIRIVLVAFVLWAGCALARAAEDRSVWLSDLDLRQMRQDLGEAHKDRTFDNKPIVIGGRAFERGIGVHAESTLELAIKPGARRLSASVGVCDEVGKNGSVEFLVFADGRQVWASGRMRGGDAAKPVDLDLAGVRIILLRVTNGGDGSGYDHGAWAEARILVSGDAPVDVVGLAPAEPAEILTPKAPATPRINGARVFGVRLGSPFLFMIAATGDRPMTFAAEGLPAGLSVDEKTGVITGRTDQRGEHVVKLRAKNALGEATRELRIVVGERIALTPPMGWNSWNCWGCDANDQRVRAIAKGFVDFGLVNHGWMYINLDDGWQGRQEHADGGPGRYPPTFALQANEKFPDMKRLCDDLHAMGLKMGLYSTPWKFSYGNYTGGSADDAQGHRDNQKVVGRHTFEVADANQWAQWGIDYMKYDWSPIDVANTKRMSDALRACGRDIVFSLSNGASLQHGKDWAELSNLWRTTGDISDTWASMSGIGFSQDPWRNFSGPGHWNDPDMLVVGPVGWGNPRPSRLTPNEQYTHISLWCLLSAPLLLGCDVSKLDEFTINLLTNDEVLEVDQDPLGQGAARVFHDDDGREVWVKTMQDGSKAVGLFNRGLFPLKVAGRWSDLGVSGAQKVRDLWRQKDLGQFDNQYETEIPRHGVVLIRLWPAR